MSDSIRPPSENPGSAPRTQPAPTLTTITGVQVTVRDTPAHRPRQQRARPDRSTRAIVLPPNQPPEDREAFMRWLVKEHGPFVMQLLLCRQDLLAESAKDVSQHVLLATHGWVAKQGRPENMRAFLRRVVRNQVSKYKEPQRLDIDLGADVDDASADASDPEEIAAHREWLEHYLPLVPEAEREVIWEVDGLGASLQEAADKFGRPLPTVAHQRERGHEKLQDLAMESERAALAGRRPVRS